MASNDQRKQTGVRLIAAVTLVLAATACTPAAGDDAAPPGGTAGPGSAPPDPTTGPDMTRPRPDAEGGSRPALDAEQAPDPCAGPADTTTLLLRQVRSAAYEDHDRVVFEFCGGRERTVFVDSVDRITENPAGRAVPLAGNAFLDVGISAATLDTTQAAGAPGQARRYSGPRRWSPGHRLVREIAVAGDFESTLSFGLGLSRPATWTVSQLADPSRVVIDIWYEPAYQLLWPFHTIEQANEVQEAFDEGHQPWVGSPEEVISLYLQHEQGWRDAELRRLSDNLYAARSSNGDRALVAVVQPVRHGAGGVWVITWFGPSRAMG